MLINDVMLLLDQPLIGLIVFCSVASELVLFIFITGYVMLCKFYMR